MSSAHLNTQYKMCHCNCRAQLPVFQKLCMCVCVCVSKAKLKHCTKLISATTLVTEGAIEPGLRTTWHPTDSFAYKHTHLCTNGGFQGGGLISSRAGMLLKDSSVCGYTLENGAKKTSLSFSCEHAQIIRQLWDS